jgi:hypothetical protein
MFELLLGGASGGVVGILGALFRHGLELWQLKKKAENDLLVLQEQNRHEQIRADKNAELIKLEAENAVKLADVNRIKETDVAAYTALSASIEGDRASYSNAPTSKWMILVDVVRGLTRPTLTAYYTILISVLALWIMSTIPPEVIKSEAFLTSTFYKLIEALIFLATASAGWWFAARMTSKADRGAT